MNIEFMVLYLLGFFYFENRLGEEYTKLKIIKYWRCNIKILEGEIRKGVSYSSENELSNLEKASSICVYALCIWMRNSVTNIRRWIATDFHSYLKGNVSKTIEL
jgi:hypothetical protein